jgi:hypothetical protein
MLELLSGQHTEHIGLIFCPRGRSVQLFALWALHDGGVVPGGDGVKTQSKTPLQHRLKLDVLIAAHAGIGSSTLRVFIDEVLHHILSESLRKIPDIKGNLQHVGNPPGIHRVFDRAAPSGPRSKSSRHPRKRQVNADNLVSRLHGARRRDGAINATAHRCQNFHAHQCRQCLREEAPSAGVSGPRPSPRLELARQRGGIPMTTASMSSSVVW